MTVKIGRVDSDVFLQNDFLSLGINAHGGLGSTKYAPTGIDTADGYRTVGLMADLDGFGKGKASTLYDAIIRGVSIEGFNIGYKIGGTKHIESNQQLDGLTEIAGTSSASATATAAKAQWTGTTDDKLLVAQTMTLADGAKYIRVDVTLTNNSSVAMTDLRYMRTADPDQGATMKTTNQIVSQGSGQALVTAAATTSGGSPYFLYANDARAVASTYGFINEDPYAANAWDTPQQAGYKVTADQSINLTFGIGTLAAGKSTVVTFYMGVTDNIAATVAAINQGTGVDTPPPPPPPAPDAVNDSVTATSGQATKGNVLSNDINASGQTLTATLKTGPAHGVLTLGSNGAFTYTADKGYVGTDSFTYTATAAGQTDSATVKITTSAPPLLNPKLPNSPTLQRAGTLDGSAAANDVLTGTAAANSFYFDNGQSTGKNKIVNFGSNDVIVTKTALNDSNSDGIITFAKSTLTLNAAKDNVGIAGVSGLRLLGTDDAGLSVYGNLSVRPTGATEGKLSDDLLRGDAPDKSVNKFFFDTALGLDLGSDQIVNFGAKDVVITTTSLGDVAAGGSLALTKGTISLGDERGDIHLTNTAGVDVAALDFDGTAVRGGVTYYIYSTHGSAADIGTAGF
jgi:VCBS repeat-containing protein